MTPEDIQASILDGTFGTRVMNEGGIQIIKHPGNNGTMQLEFKAAPWFVAYVPVDVQTRFKQHIMNIVVAELNDFKVAELNDFNVTVE